MKHLNITINNKILHEMMLLHIINFLIKLRARLNYKQLFDVKFMIEIFMKYRLQYLVVQNKSILLLKIISKITKTLQLKYKQKLFTKDIKNAKVDCLS